jgi:phospholipid/cholesterol/gamma-HCH transport system substrate-binding protein
MDLENVITPFKVGLVVLAAIMATLYMVTTLTRGEGLGTGDGTVVYAMFSDVTGLARNSRVKMSGIPVGTLESMELQGDKVRVNIRLTKDVELHRGVEQPSGIYENGATVTKKQSSMLGDYFLELTPGTEGPVLNDGDQIMNVTQTVGMDQLFAKFDRIATDIETITGSLSEVLGGKEGAKRLKTMLDDLQTMLETMRGFVDRNSGKVDKILANAEQISGDIERISGRGSRSIERILTDVQSVVREVKRLVRGSSGDVEKGVGSLRSTLTQLEKTLQSLDHSASNVRAITDKVNEGEGAVGKLINDPTIADKTESILTDVENFTNQFDRLRTIVELRSTYHIQHERFKTAFGLRLQPGPNKYYLAEFIDDFRGTRSVIRKDVNTTRADAKDGLYRETTVKTTDDFKFSFQIARSLPITDWMKLTGRFGIIESSGGIGGNILFLEDQSIDIQADVFDFGVSRNPRFRTFASYDVLEYAYITGGVDDIFNSDRRDYFVGAGIQFDDEDLKALLTTTGVPSGP